MSDISDAAAAVDNTIATLEGQLETLFAAAAVLSRAAASAGAKEKYSAAVSTASHAVSSAVAKARAAANGKPEPALVLVADRYPAE